MSPDVSQDPGSSSDSPVGSGGKLPGMKPGGLPIGGRRDSLSPDISSATEDMGAYRNTCRRDSRPLLSPEPGGGGDMSSGCHSRDSSPRPPRRASLINRRRSSGMSDDGSKRLKTKSPLGQNDNSSSAQSSREHSPKGINVNAPPVA